MKIQQFLIRNWQIILVLVLGLFVSWPLFVPGYFSHHDDLQIMRIFEMRSCFSDLQIPCRWVPDMGFGNGFPLFNFYGPLPYYLGGLISYFAGYILSAKIIFFLATALGGVSMYFLVKDFTDKNSALAASALFLLAPYRALDAYVRGALAELFAISLLPLVLLLFYRLVKNPKPVYFAFSALSLAALLTTHNIMTILFLPVVILWLIYWLWTQRFKNVKGAFLALALGMGMAAFFLLPAFLEKSLVQTEALTRFELDFRAHFVTLKQLFLDRFWGYGASTLGPVDGISFQLGWPHWWLALLAGVSLFIGKDKKLRILTLGLMLLFAVSAIMTHNKSAFIWERIGILKYFQFPWRFLSLAVICSSLLGGIIVFSLREKWRIPAALFIVALTFLFNWEYFRPKEFYYFLNDNEKLSGPLWEEQQKGAILDYLPRTALEPQEKAPSRPYVVAGGAALKDFINKSNGFSFTAEVGKSAQVEIPVFYFPGWKVQVDGKDVPVSFENILGRIAINLEPGSHEVKGSFGSTPVRTIANTISLGSLFLLVILLYAKGKKLFS
jgi:hypothetical protein